MTQRVTMRSPVNGGIAYGLMTVAGSPYTVAEAFAAELVNRGVAVYTDAQPPATVYALFVTYLTSAQLAQAVGVLGITYEVTDVSGRPQYRWDGTAFVAAGGGGGGGITTIAAATDKTSIDLPTVNAPLADALAAQDDAIALKAPLLAPANLGTGAVALTAASHANRSNRWNGSTDQTVTIDTTGGTVGDLYSITNIGSGTLLMPGTAAAGYKRTIGPGSGGVVEWLGGSTFISWIPNNVGAGTGSGTLFEANFNLYSLTATFGSQDPNVSNDEGHQLVAKLQGSGALSIEDGGDHHYGKLAGIAGIYYGVTSRPDFTLEAFCAGGGSKMHFHVRDDGGLSSPYDDGNPTFNDVNSYRVTIDHSNGHVTVNKMTAGAKGSDLLDQMVPGTWVDTDHTWKLVLADDNTMQIKCNDVDIGTPVAITGSNNGVRFEGQNGANSYINTLKAYFP